MKCKKSYLCLLPSNVFGQGAGGGVVEGDGGRQLKAEGSLQGCAQLHGSKRVQASLHQRLHITLLLRLRCPCKKGLPEPIKTVVCMEASDERCGVVRVSQ